MKTSLILTVGGSPDPLIKKIKETQTDLIYFIHSKQSKENIKEILEKSEYSKEYRLKEIENINSLEDAYLSSKEVFKELKNESWILKADFTGGTKTMSAGFALSAVGEECQTTYIGAKSTEGRNKDGMGAVKNGFELIKKQIDPFNKYAVLEFNMGKKFFNKYQFEAAEENFKIAYEKLEDKNLKELSKIYLKIVKLYKHWDKFNNTFEDKTTLNSYLKKEILDKIEETPYLKEYFQKEEKEFHIQMQENLEFLKNKISKNYRKIKKELEYYLPDLLNNTKRRIEEEKYDDAVARLYRLIELIGQINLNNLGLLNEERLQKNQKFYIDNTKLRETLNKDAINLIDDDTGKVWNEKTSKIGLRKTYELLKTFNNKTAILYLNDEDLVKDINIRNQSVLAHGITPMKEELSKSLLKRVNTYSKLTIENIEELEKMAKYPKFKDLRI